MIRLMVRTDDATMAANVGGAVLSSYRTFDIDAPEMERFVRATLDKYTQRQVIAVELLPVAES